MALNLNKGGNDENPSSSSDTEKKSLNLDKSENVSPSRPNLNKSGIVSSSESKGLNLSKSGDSSEKTNVNLAKDKTGFSSNPNNRNTDKQPSVTKKSPVFVILSVLALIGLGTFLFLNTNNPNQSEATVGPEVVSEAQNSNNAVTVDEISTTANANTTQASEASMASGGRIPQSSSSGSTDGTSNVSQGSPNAGNQSGSNNNLSSNGSASSSGSIEEKARQVISGSFGNGEERKQALGTEYAAIQAKVNELYKNNRQ